MVDSQPIEEEFQGAGTRDAGMETPRGPIKPVLQTLKPPSPSPSFIKENIDVLKTMIKEHDQHAKMKATLRKLAYVDSDKEAPARSLARGFSDRFSLESSGTSDTHRQTHYANKCQRTPSKNKEPTHLKRSRRLEYQSITKEKARRERPKPTPFTQRITHFKYHRRAKLPWNIRVYEGNKDPEDHFGIFSAAAEQEEWLMPIWCKMFHQTLGGAARNWFDDLDPKSVDSFEELSQKFLEEFSQQKRYAKDPTEIHGIKRRQNEGLQAFMDRFKSESSHIKGVPPVLRISAFMHGHGHPELAKKLNDKIPKTVDEMFERVRAFIRGEVAVGTLKEILAMESGSQHQRLLSVKKQTKEAVASGKLTHLVKDIYRTNQRNGNQGRNNVKNSQKQGNAGAMVTAPTDGKLPLCERCFTCHVGQCTIKCGKVGHKIRKIKQEEVEEARGRAYAIKDAEPKGPNVETGTFMLNNRCAFILFDSGSDRSFADTRFSSMLNIDPVKIGASYEVELADGRVASTNTFLKCCTLNLVNHVFEIDLMPIELGTFDVIIGMDWLIKHDAMIVCGEKVVRIPYGNKILIVESDKGVSRLKVISCIKARKYVKRGCHLFLAYVTENKSKKKRLEDVPVIHDFPEVFPEELPGLPPPRQVEF
ncbi:reverse transcriptase domain-containing protein [Tanacetum coccineum]|uniref:Reverse transcriptase domain-containing protein n=1 Tax=Tanacetum coccineum TaxID=301880 RepID=A0ABQ5GJA1_9ASTR